MNARPVLRAGYRTGLLALALAFLLSACASPFQASVSGSANHHCSDLFANAAVGKVHIGLWNCLSHDLQNKVSAGGQSGDDAMGAAFGTSYTYAGAGQDTQNYEVRLIPSLAAQYGAEVVLAVWVDSTGRVTNAGIASQAY